MKRVVAAFLLLSTAVALAVWSGITYQSKMGGLEKQLEDLVICAQNGSDDEIKSQTEKLTAEWKSSSELLHSLVVHEGMDDLEETITSLPLLLEHSTKEEFIKACIEAINLIENLTESERLNIGNIL
ncbi:MAG: DUF4363 family protein [Clostridia bacterium]|nr:DUF4363 family protein [Clostridia bacterium]